MKRVAIGKVKMIFLKDEWCMYAWLGMMLEMPYVWFFLLHFFENKFEFILISLLFRIHGIILPWFFLFTFQNHFFGLISLLTCMKFPKTWKGLDEVVKINYGVGPIWIGLRAQNMFGLYLVIDGMKEMMGTSKSCS